MVISNILKSLIKSSSLFNQTATSYNLAMRSYNTSRRALLYVPGNDLKKLKKAFNLKVDCIAMDCEDGVAINKKKEARETIRDILNEEGLSGNYSDLGVRINSVESGLCEDDLNEILSAKHLPDTVLLPKVECIDHIKWFSTKVNLLIKRDVKINLIMYIESARAMIDLEKICSNSFELSEQSKFLPVSLVFGSDDFCADIGVTRTEDSTEILYARQKFVLYAKAFNLQAIDMVYIKYKDLDGLRIQCEQGAKFGFTGKQVIHPGQIDIVQNAFMPNKKQIEWAVGLLEAFEEHQKSGKGAFNYKGSMIDMPTMKQAQNIVALAVGKRGKSS